jgi:hypothetical protein
VRLKKEKKYYDVKLEVYLPAVISYRILAEDAAQAESLIRNIAPVGVKYKLAGKKDLKITVYESGSTIIRFIKNIFRG